MTTVQIQEILDVLKEEYLKDIKMGYLSSAKEIRGEIDYWDKRLNEKLL